MDVDRFAEGVGLGQNRGEGIVQAGKKLFIAWEAVLAVDGVAVFGHSDSGKLSVSATHTIVQVSL